MNERRNKLRMHAEDYEAEWQRCLSTRPPEIREVALAHPPNQLYKMDSGHTVVIVSYVEANAGAEKCDMCEDGVPHNGHISFDHVTVKVAVLKKFNPDIAIERVVFGVTPKTLISIGPLP